MLMLLMQELKKGRESKNDSKLSVLGKLEGMVQFTK